MAKLQYYCPPRFTITKDKFEEFFSSLGNGFLACGDHIAKYTYPKRNQLYTVLMVSKNGLDCPLDRRRIGQLILGKTQS